MAEKIKRETRLDNAVMAKKMNLTTKKTMSYLFLRDRGEDLGGKLAKTHLFLSVLWCRGILMV